MIREFFDKNDETLNLYTKAITRAHGRNHPEVFEVRSLLPGDSGQGQEWQLRLGKRVRQAARGHEQLRDSG